MITLPQNTRFNKGVYNCTCGFRAENANVTPYMLGISSTQWGEMVVWQCPRCEAKWMFHNRKRVYDYSKSFEAYKNGENNWFEKGLV